MLRKFYQKHHAVFSRFDAILLKNPVLERGLTIAPVIVAGNTVNNGLALGTGFVLILFVSVMLTFFIPKKFPYTFRVILHALVASLVFIPVAMLVEKWFPGAIFNLGIYLPLLVVNSLIVQKSESRFHKMALKDMILQLFCNMIGFFLIIFVVSAVRELLGKGTFAGHPVDWMQFRVSVALLPCGGFLIAGFLAASVKKFTRYLNRDATKPQLPKKAGEKE